MPTQWQRDLETDAPKFARWLETKLGGAADVQMSSLVAPQSSGFSNETLLFELTYTKDGERHEEARLGRTRPPPNVR